MFVRNAWYPVAWERQIGASPHGVRALGDDIAVYRCTDGSYAALEDACAHRKVPLTLARVVGDAVECGYHGMVFDRCGTCLAAPTNGGVVPNAPVRSYAAVARYGLVWLWMGDAEQADPATIFSVDEWDNPDWGTTTGEDMVMPCDYRYIIDNLLDPSHVAWVHPTSFAGAGTEDTPMQVTIDDTGVTVSRWMLDVEPAPFYAPYLAFAGRCDRKQQYEIRYPSHGIIRAFFCPVGTGGEGRPWHPDTFKMDSYNFLTPIDERTTHYFWFQQRNVAPHDDAVSVRFAESVRGAFTEDKQVLQAVQAGMDRAGGSHVNLRSDTGGVRFRRRLAQLVEAEQAGASVT